MPAHCDRTTNACTITIHAQIDIRGQIDPTATAMTVGRIAGGMLFGPVGIAVAFTSIGDAAANPCLEAVKTAEKGVATKEKGFLKSY